MHPVALPETCLVGLDLAWGERNPDGVASFEARDGVFHLATSTRTQGDAELIHWVRELRDRVGKLLVCIDAPVVCPNAAGARPVDRETHREFGRFYAGAHPANRARCARPLRVVAALEALGLEIGWDLASGGHQMVEVYPHPAQVRLFGLDRILKYKRPPVLMRRLEFARYQSLLQAALARDFPEVGINDRFRELLEAPWSKSVEDRLDACFCALIGAWHWRHQGRRSQILGDRQTGFILVPQTGSPA
jgi:predicted RNase H-like nuclease